MIIEWLRKLFKKTTASESKLIPLKTKLQTIKLGDFIDVILNSYFCDYALKQPKLRFTHKELTEQKIKGIVQSCNFDTTLSCYVLSVQTVDNELGKAITKTTLILQDEIKDVIIHE